MKLRINVSSGATYCHLHAPDGGVCEGVPHIQVAVVAAGDKLVLTRVGGKTPQLIHVALES